MLINTTTTASTPVAPVPVVPALHAPVGAAAVPAPTGVRPICTTDHLTIASANASWLYEQKTFGNHTVAMKRHSQRERPT